MGIYTSQYVLLPIKEFTMNIILITGTAGFIGYHVAMKMLAEGHQILGIDSINDYYDISLKYGRLAASGFSMEQIQEETPVVSHMNPNYTFIKMNLLNKQTLTSIFDQYQIKEVIHLAAQPGVRYSIDNPDTYMDNNILAFYQLLECCRHHQIKHLTFASSSSIYGNDKEIPFSINSKSDHPISFYAATKKTNELMGYCYSHLYKLPITCLRFFTAYGPWGRPDMALFKFTRAILEDKPLNVFGQGKMSRDFTYVKDIAEGLYLASRCPPQYQEDAAYKIYNIGKGSTVKLLDFIKIIENVLNKKARLNLMPLQDGDVLETWADISEMQKDFGYTPTTDLNTGVTEFVHWFRQFYNI